MQSSGEAGVVVVTFGSMVTNFTSERAEVIATAFGRLPQKVFKLTVRDYLVFGWEFKHRLCSGHLEIQWRSSESTVGKHQAP